MDIQIIKCNNHAYVACGIATLLDKVGETVEVSVVDPCGDEVLTVSGIRHVLHDGKTAIKTALIDGSDMHLYSGDKMYVIEGLKCEGGVLKIIEPVIHQYVCRLIIENHLLGDRLDKAEEKITMLEQLCSGEDFL